MVVIAMEVVAFSCAPASVPIWVVAWVEAAIGDPASSKGSFLPYSRGRLRFSEEHSRKVQVRMTYGISDGFTFYA
jgi:hypothetical protein